MAKLKKSELIEKLAALEHEQWIAWAENILETEDITEERANRWRDLFVPYSELTEEMKDKDREWAEKIINILQDNETK